MAGDFNGDGTSDLLWRASTDSSAAIWQMANGGVAGAVALPTMPTQWHVIAAGDFNQDGNTDLVWRASTDGTTAIDLDDVVAGFRCTAREVFA